MQSFKVSAPGSKMLLGEHAVLHGFPAIVCAINRRLTVTLTPRQDEKITLISASLGKHETTIDNLSIQKPFQFVLACLLKFQKDLKSGCDIIIESEFSHKLGFGSSAAVTAATLYVLKKWLGKENDLHEIHKDGLDVIRSVQKIGSGADLAASIFGGVVFYQMSQPCHCEEAPADAAISSLSLRATEKSAAISSLSSGEVRGNDFLNPPPVKGELEGVLNKETPPNLPLSGEELPLTLVYSGYKTSTAEVIQKVKAAESKNPETFKRLYEDIGKLTEQGKNAIEKSDWKTLGNLFNQSYELQKKLGTSDETLDKIVTTCQKQPTVYGAKISGAGLGDCVIALGELPKDLFEEQMSIKIEKPGVTLQ